MAVKLNSYIHFKDNAKEAAEFYKSVFGGEVFMDTFEKFASTDMPVAEEDKQKIMHAYLKGDNGIELMMSDTPSNMEYQDGMRISLTLNGDDEAMLRDYWDKLAADGQVTVPLDKSPWGDVFGMLTDKFGVDWMIDIGPVQGQ
jgi:PhnB protein